MPRGRKPRVPPVVELTADPIVEPTEPEPTAQANANFTLDDIAKLIDDRIDAKIPTIAAQVAQALNASMTNEKGEGSKGKKRVGEDVGNKEGDPRSKKTRYQGTYQKCARCDLHHVGECPRCRRCKRIGHFAKFCKAGLTGGVVGEEMSEREVQATTEDNPPMVNIDPSTRKTPQDFSLAISLKHGTANVQTQEGAPLLVPKVEGQQKSPNSSDNQQPQNPFNNGKGKEIKIETA